MNDDPIVTTFDRKLGVISYYTQGDGGRTESGSRDGATAECAACGRDFTVPGVMHSVTAYKFSSRQRRRIAKARKELGCYHGPRQLRFVVCPSCFERIG